MMKIVAKLYKGKYSLSKSYWLFGNVVPLILFTLILISIFVFSNDPLNKLRSLNFRPETTFSLITTVILSLVTLVYIIISTIGVWRSASKYQGKKIWPILAKITIVIAFISYLNDIRKFFIS